MQTSTRILARFGKPPPRVSVVITTHNRSAWLRNAVDSVLAQTYPNVEIVVVDDGSTDDTAEVLATFRGRLRYIRQANRGVSAARNAGVRAAHGELIGFLDDDDWLLPAKIECQVALFQSRPEIDVVYCGHYVVDREGHPIERNWALPEPDILSRLTVNCFLPPHTLLIRRSGLERVKLAGGEYFDESLGWSEDWDLWLRMALAGSRYASLLQPHCCYRVASSGKMENADGVARGAQAVLARVFARTDLPDRVRLLEPEAAARQHLWLGWMYYASGRWDAAQDHLRLALPYHRETPERWHGLLGDLVGYALNPRIGDPDAFVSAVFEHLPPEAPDLAAHQAYVRSYVIAGQALRRYRTGSLGQAQELMARAVAADPAFVERPDEFSHYLFHETSRAPVDLPLQYADTVLRNLPDAARLLVRSRPRVLSDVSVGIAFETFSSAQWGRVVWYILTALRYRPAVLGNRGVRSILARSLFRSLFPLYGT